jgi:hypothetical protein
MSLYILAYTVFVTPEEVTGHGCSAAELKKFD